jgi:hypothetical protein
MNRLRLAEIALDLVSCLVEVGSQLFNLAEAKYLEQVFELLSLGFVDKSCKSAPPEKKVVAAFDPTRGVSSCDPSSRAPQSHHFDFNVLGRPTLMMKNRPTFSALFSNRPTEVVLESVRNGALSHSVLAQEDSAAVG